MSKAKEKMLERRRRQIKAMNDFIETSDNKTALAGWDSTTNGRTYPEIAADEECYRACCRYFRRIVNDVFWEADTE